MQGLFCFCAKMTIKARKGTFCAIFAYGETMAGRPRKDSIDTSALIINLAKSGMTNTDIAEATGLSLRTVQYWLSDTDLGKVVNAARKARQALEAEEKAKLNKNALQAAMRLLKKHKSTEKIERTDGNGKLLYTETRTKEIEPNAGIVQFVLKNTDPQNWSDNPAPLPTEAAEDNELTIEIVDGDNDD